MRKEIVYSLAAVAAFPVVASAAESGVNATQLQVSGPGVKTMKLTPDAGIQVKAGKYQLAFTNLTAGYKVNFTVKQKQGTAFVDYALTNGEAAIDTNIPLGGGGLGGPTQSEAFVLEDGVYEITLTTTAETGMEAAGACLQLVFDFQGACDVLKAKMVSEVNVIKNFKNPKAQPDISKLNEWEGIIDSVGMVNYATEFEKLVKPAGFAANDETTWSKEQKDFKKAYWKSTLGQEGVNLKGYELFEKYNLNAIPQDTITSNIIKLAAAAKANELAYMQEVLDELEEQLSELEDGKLKTNLQKEIDDAQDLIDGFRDGDNTSDEVWDAIDNINSTPQGVKQDVEDALEQQEFFADIVNPFYEKVDSALKADSAIVAKALEAYEDLKKEADTTFMKIDTLLQAIKADIDTAYNNLALETEWAGLETRLKGLWTPAVLDGETVVDEEKGKIIDAMNFYLNLGQFMIHGDSVLADPNKFNVLNADENALYEGDADDEDGNFLSKGFQLAQYADILEDEDIADGFDQEEWEEGVADAVEALQDAVLALAKEVNETNVKPVTPNTNFAASADIDFNDEVDAIDEALKALDDAFGPYRIVLDSIDSLTLHLDTMVAKLDSFKVEKLKKIAAKPYNGAEYDFIPSVRVKDDQNQLGIKRFAENVLFRDSLKDEIDSLKEEKFSRFIDEGDLDQEALDDACEALRTKINKLFNIMNPAAEKFVKTQLAIDSLYDELKAIEDFAKENNMYTQKYPLKDENGDTVAYIGGYKARIDSIMNNVRKEQLDKIYSYDWETPELKSEDLGTGIAKLQALLDSAMKSRGVADVEEFTKAKDDSVFNYYMSKIDGAEENGDTALISKCIALLKENLKTDSAKIDSLAEVAAFEALKKSVREMCDSLKDMITRIAGPQIITDFNKLATEEADYTGSEIADLLADDQKQIAEMLKAVADTLRKSGVGTDVLFMKIWDNPNEPNTWGRSYWEKAHNDRAAADKPYSKTLFDQLGEDSEKLIKLLETMDKIKEYIENAKEAMAENQEAYEALNKEFVKFLKKVDDAKKLVEDNEECSEVYNDIPEDTTDPDENNNLISAKPWYDAKLGAIGSATSSDTKNVANIPGSGDGVDVAKSKDYPEGSIMDSFKKIVAKADAAKGAGKLVGNTAIAAELAELTTELTKGIDTIKIKQANLNSLQLLESFDQPIKDAENDAKERLASEEGQTPSAYDHYMSEIDKIMFRYQGKTPLIDENEKYARGEESDSVGIIDNAYYDYSGDTLVAMQRPYLNDIVDVITDLDDIQKRMQSNKTNLPRVKKDSTDVHKDITDAQTALAAYVAEFGDADGNVNKVNQLLKDLEALNIDSLYKNGALEDDSLVGDEKRQKEIKRIADELDNIITSTYGSSNVAQRKQDNKDIKAIGDKAKEARAVYETAVDLDDIYKKLKSKTLRAAVEKAKELSEKYNNDLKDYPAQINAAADAAVKNIKDFRKAEETKDADYSREALANDTAVFRTIMDEIDSLKNDFQEDVLNAISSAASAYVTAFNDALKDSSYMDPTKTPNYIQYADSGKAAGQAFIDLIAEFKDLKKPLNEALAKLGDTDNAIKTLDDKLLALENYKTTGKSYAEVKENALEARAEEDLMEGLKKAMELIRKADLSIYGKPGFRVKDEDLNAEWEAKKATILGEKPEEDYVLSARRAPGESEFIGEVVDIEIGYGYRGGLYTRIDTLEKAKDFRTEAAAIYKILDDFINDTQVMQAAANTDAYDKTLEAAETLQAQLDAAREANKNALAISAMNISGGYKQAQDAIEKLVKDAKEAFEKGSCSYDKKDSTEISRLIKIASTMIGDTLAATVDTAVTIEKGKTLFGMEGAYLKGMESKLWTLFNKAAANYWNGDNTQSDANLAKYGKPIENEIIDIMHDIDSLNAITDAKKVDAAKMLAQQTRVEAVVNALLGYAGDGGHLLADSMKEALKAEVAAVAAKIAEIDLDDYEGLTNRQYNQLEDKQELLEGLIDGLSEEIAAADRKNILLKEDKYKTQIAALGTAISDLVKEIETVNAQNDKQKQLNKRAQRYREELQEILDEMEEAFDKFDNLENDYTNRLALVNQRAANLMSELVDGISAEALDSLEDVMEELGEDIEALVDVAANEDIKNIADALEERADAIKLDEDDFLASDYEALTDSLDKIKKAIATYSQGWFGQRGQLNGGLKYKAQRADYDDYDDLKKEAEQLEARLDALEAKIKALTGGGDLPPVVLTPGDIDQDGFVTSDDVEEFLDDLLEGDLPEPGTAMFIIYDVNEDGLINIADAQGIQNLSLGLNVDGSVPGVLAARSTEALSGSVTAESTQLQNGAQRITLTLSGNFDWTGFQLDVKGAEVLSESAAITLKSAEKNGTHRIVAFGSKQGNGQVITLDVQGNAKLGTITFTTANAQAVSFKLSGTTGIYGITTESSNIFYDLSGKLVKGMKKGVNIIRDAAGKAKKAIMK